LEARVDIERNGWAEATTEVVVKRAAGGDEQAWRELHRRYARLIAAIARSSGCPAADRPDVQQAVWMRLVDHIERLRQPAALAGWLTVVTRTECLRRAGSRPEMVYDYEIESVPDDGDEPLAAVLDADRRAAVRTAVAALPPRRRALIETMLDRPELCYEELAGCLSMPVGSIGPSRQRSLDELRECRELMDWRPSAVPASRTGDGRSAILEVTRVMPVAQCPPQHTDHHAVDTAERPDRDSRGPRGDPRGGLRDATPLRP
jgi:RNA polymerase sigma factor (sigma-70 family)